MINWNDWLILCSISGAILQPTAVLLIFAAHWTNGFKLQIFIAASIFNGKITEWTSNLFDTFKMKTSIKTTAEKNSFLSVRINQIVIVRHPIVDCVHTSHRIVTDIYDVLCWFLMRSRFSIETTFRVTLNEENNVNVRTSSVKYFNQIDNFSFSFQSSFFLLTENQLIKWFSERMSVAWMNYGLIEDIFLISFCVIEVDL